MQKSEIADLLLKSLPRDLVLGLQDAVYVAAERASKAAMASDPGHRATVLGTQRHWHSNELFHEVFEANGCNPQKLRGNKIVEGRSGIFTILRENYCSNKWNKFFKSQQKKIRISENKRIQQLVQPDLFDEDGSVTNATVFILCCYSGSLQQQPESPVAIYVTVPSADGKSFLFHEPIGLFLSRYEVAPQQEDKAVVTLKAGVIKKIEENDRDGS
ncbi:hypothetical protein [Aeromonas veronii]|uniref:hypothetical protein n=1 Tax=Aeromonas veronii TaxID=654 RepID=UPI003F7940E9